MVDPTSTPIADQVLLTSKKGEQSRNNGVIGQKINSAETTQEQIVFSAELLQAPSLVQAAQQIVYSPL